MRKIERAYGVSNSIQNLFNKINYRHPSAEFETRSKVGQIPVSLYSRRLNMVVDIGIHAHEPIKDKELLKQGIRLLRFRYEQVVFKKTLKPILEKITSVIHECERYLEARRELLL